MQLLWYYAWRHPPPDVFAVCFHSSGVWQTTMSLTFSKYGNTKISLYSNLVNHGQSQGQQSMLTLTRRVHLATRRVPSESIKPKTRVNSPSYLSKVSSSLVSKRPKTRFRRPKTLINSPSSLRIQKMGNRAQLVELAKQLIEFLQPFSCSVLSSWIQGSKL